MMTGARTAHAVAALHHAAKQLCSSSNVHATAAAEFRTGEAPPSPARFSDAPTNVRVRKRPTSIETPPALTACCQVRPPQTSMSRTSLVARIFARCAPLVSLHFLRGSRAKMALHTFFEGRPGDGALRTRIRAFSLQRAEQKRCRRARRATSRPQLAQAPGASRREALKASV